MAASEGLTEWLSNPDNIGTLRDLPPPVPWYQSTPFLLSMAGMLFLVAAYRFRRRILSAIEELVVSLGAAAISSSRAAQAGFGRISGKIRERANQPLE